MADEKGVMIVGELVRGTPAPICYELLGAGRKLADSLGEQLSILIMADNISSDTTSDLIASGADRVYAVAHPVLGKYHPDSFAAVAEKVAKDKKPNILLMGRTEVGQDLAPMLSYRLDAGLLMDCLDLKIDPASKMMIMERPVYGGNARSVLHCETKPQMASVKPKTQEPLPKDTSRKGEVETISVDLSPSINRTQFVEHISWVSEGVQLESAELIISGGRGIGSTEAYKATIDVAAKVIGGAAGASKAACDAGYAPPGNQVGLTGKRVSPTLYVAVAISGASQHLAGMGTSKNIVAINRDPDANMFKVARYGVVADYKQVMPAFIEKLKELLAE
ncbi:MAG: electron transfer flavoprotein subunit alpha/FixB family protein [Dehalococcoidia bacterium]|nr:electron transfer flavoprotein subunit alpha/FixB family protein [Dehalococcoidia bacterium]